MRDAATFIAEQPSLFGIPAAPPLGPWDYLRLRREDAGLSIERLADRIGGRAELRGELIDILRSYERPGVRLKNVEWHSYSRHFAFDPEVYRQLAELPPEQHPRVCRGCGWDRWAVQADLDGNDRAFSAERPDLCTRCEQIETRGLRRKAA